MSEIIDIKEEFKTNAYINPKKYDEMYKESIDNPEKFWADQANDIDWFKKWDKVMDYDFNTAEISWYTGGKLNVSYNCIDRHLEKRGDQTAIIWESDDPNLEKKYTYNELHKEVSRFSNVLKKHGVVKGDVVIIYMPMIPELAIAVLACARIGAIHSVVFGGFSSDSLNSRILDCKPKLIICADRGVRGSKSVPSKSNADIAMDGTDVEKCIVVKRTGEETNMLSGRDFWWDEEVNDSSISDDCPPEEMDAEDPLFILYTSGSTGKPKGVLHTTGGYIVYTSLTHKYVFDYKDGDIFWCTADIGWITGHSYIIYGPLANGATTVMFEGVPQYPDWGRFWDVIDKHKVNIFYTAPTAIRAIARMGDHHVSKRKLDSLKLLGTVGEPINPEAWLWYYNVIGKGKLPIVDTWWQTETGGILISPLPGATKLKPGSATKPLFGIEPLLVDNEGNELEGATSGNLCIKSSWPGQMRGVYGDPDRFYNTYFTTYKGYYFTGDGCRRDEDGYYWITGRVDDVINVSGHRLGTAEIESALVLHKNVAESAVVGFPHEIKGQGIYAYITLNQGVEATDKLKKDLVQQVRTQIGPIATIDKVQWAPGLPKTRSGKIMRRILRKIAEKDLDNIGDTSTLAEPEVVDDLVKNAVK
jgi:acetyl-CoA synthetase|tara:strand:- start:2027 stop:3955 length:1929 start_codon:yes stop_codon:yes gene_type:complete